MSFDLCILYIYICSILCSCSCIFYQDYICVHCIYNVKFDFTEAQNLPLQSELDQASPFVKGEARKEFTDKNLYKNFGSIETEHRNCSLGRTLFILYIVWVFVVLVIFIHIILFIINCYEKILVSIIPLINLSSWGTQPLYNWSPTWFVWLLGFVGVYRDLCSDTPVYVIENSCVLEKR